MRSVLGCQEYVNRSLRKLKTLFDVRRSGTEEKLREKLERTNMNDFVAIEPDSGEYFFGKTLSEAIQASRGPIRTVWHLQCVSVIVQRFKSEF